MNSIQEKKMCKTGERLKKLRAKESFWKDIIEMPYQAFLQKYKISWVSFIKYRKEARNNQ